MELDDGLKNDDIETLIFKAAEQGCTDLLRNYLSIIKDPNIYLNHLYNNEPNKQTKCTILMTACLKQYKGMIEMLLNNFKPDLDILNIVRITDRDKQLEVFEDVTVLWVATALNDFDIVKLLVEHGADINHRTKTNSTPVRCACCNDNIEMVRYLVEHGADVHITKIKHFTNLVASTFNGHLQMVTYLVDELGCDVNECLDDGRSPLGAAVYHGSYELVEFLLKRGARNCRAQYNQMSPLMLAVEKRRQDLVDIISCHSTLVEQIEAEELFASTFICAELGYSNFAQAIKYLTRALELRSIHQLPKVLQEVTHEVFNHRQECQTIDQLKELEANSDKLYIEALLIRERLLGPTNTKYRHSLRYRGALLADNGEYYRGIALWMYELSLHQQYSIDIDKEDLRHFVSLFSSMMSTSLLVPIQSLYTVMTVIISELKRNTIDFDYHLYTLLFLITIASQIFFEKDISDAEYRLIYQLIRVINQNRYATQALGSSLLHLCLNEWTTADDYSFDRIYRYPCLRTVRLLLSCGADINANNMKQFTPLHVFVSNSNSSDETILQLLCHAGAHLDYVNAYRETPLDVAFHTNIQQLLKTKMSLRLKCLCARRIQKAQITVDGLISKPLVAFVQRH